ncbi:hypothetical protein GZH47_16760 [Paenibacillus rhizovicinus]|uniref:HD-GYP domain-containing protein n=1 Tax=Paenibacillus rhizovicinus TaxID=2704463 RepID=A0A6C0P1D5_9BACL|nr:HD domain-containing phosphohydrolase [Paenibacillus rhizovicinus]QHW32294.1 hypothetical protein GZH47_16760 [Paenibacillus rhizovicinus]
MKVNALLTMPIQRMLMILIGSISAGMAVVSLLDKSFRAGFDSLDTVWISLTIAISSWGMYGVQRHLPARHGLSKLLAVWYILLAAVFISLYMPAFIVQIWGIFLFYPILISLIASFKEYVYASGMFFLYNLVYTLFIPAFAKANGSVTISDIVLELLLALGSVLLGGIILIAAHQLKKKHEEQFFQQQKQQVLNTLQCFIPVGERKTQTSRKEISDMSSLIKALWRTYGGEASKEWEIELLSLLHFVSRVKLPDYMFEKEGKLSEFELEVVQEHCYMAKELCAGIPGFEEVEQVFLYHHEKVDGTGYPFRLSGEQIPVLSQMLGIVEVFIAITTPRSYRQVMSEQAAYEEIRKMSGSFFRPDIIEAFGKVIQ